MNQKKRTNIYKSFKQGNIRVLLASDVISRGMDFSDVSHIINYDIPTNINTYIHRCGRSGRLKDTGISISLISKTDNQEVVEYILDNSKEYIYENENKTLNTKLEKTKEQKHTTTLIIRAGKKDKIRLIDIVGSLSNYIDSSIIGVINLQDKYTTVEILKQNFDLEVLNDYRIKGKKQKVEISRNK